MVPNLSITYRNPRRDARCNQIRVNYDRITHEEMVACSSVTTAPLIAG